MKAFKSMVLLTAGVLAFSACDKKRENETTATGMQDTTMGTGTGMSNDNTVAPAPLESSPGAAVGTGAAAGSELRDDTTTEGTGAVSDEAVSEEIQAEEYIPSSEGTGRGDDYEFIDESSSEPNNVRGGRDARMVPKNNQIDNTSSEPDL